MFTYHHLEISSSFQVILCFCSVYPIFIFMYLSFEYFLARLVFTTGKYTHKKNKYITKVKIKINKTQYKVLPMCNTKTFKYAIVERLSLTMQYVIGGVSCDSVFHVKMLAHPCCNNSLWQIEKITDWVTNNVAFFKTFRDTAKNCASRLSNTAKNCIRFPLHWGNLF